MENKIQFNAAIYPKVMSIIIGNPYNKNENDSDEMVPELVVDLPRSAYLIYLQKIFDEHALFAGQRDLRAVSEQPHFVADVAERPQRENTLSLPAGQPHTPQAGLYLGAQHCGGKRLCDVVVSSSSKSINFICFLIFGC